MCRIFAKLFGKNSDKTFTVKLYGNATTGYLWSYTQSGIGAVREKEFFTYADKNPGIVGAGCMNSWVFEGIKPGDVRLEFVYARPWEKQAIKTERYDLSVGKDMSVKSSPAAEK